MYLIDRPIAIIRPRQPLVHWINTTSGPDHVFTLEQVSKECLTLLMPNGATDGDAEEPLKDRYADIFVVALAGWCTDENLWPNDRSYVKFREWFDVEFHSMVFDANEDDIGKKPYEYMSFQNSSC